MKLLKIASLVLVVAAVVAACGGSVSATIGGTVSGLASGASVGLTNTSNGDVITYAFTTASNTFTFDKSVSSGSSYNVTITSQPTGQTCSVTNGNGTIDSGGDDVTNIQVICTAGAGTAVPLSASIVGLASGATLVLTDVSAGTLTVTGTAASASGTITQNFPTSLLPGAVYSTTITTQPSGQTCTILNTSGAGTVPTTGNPSPEAIACT
jgi:hypothetical protein